MVRHIVMGMAFFGCLTLTACSDAAPKIAIGEKAPGWSGLDGVDGKSHSISDLKDVKTIAVVFTCNGCPIAKAYEGRLKSFANDYKDKGVKLVAIHVHKGESLKDARERAEKEEFNFPYIHDETQEVAKNYGAKTTPHVFLLDGERNVAYMGAMDDNMNESKVTKKYLRDAVDAVLDGRQPETMETKPVGCSVKYK